MNFRKSSHKDILLSGIISIALMMTFFQGCSRSDSQKDRGVLLTISDNWEYRWGDSPVDTEGVPVWTYEGSINTNWRPIEFRQGVFNPEDRQGRNILWLRTKLPEDSFRDLQVWIQFVGFACEVYHEKRIVYRFKSVNVPGQGRFTENVSHQFGLQQEFQDRILYFRIYSEDPTQIGLGVVRVGSQADFTHALIEEVFSVSTFGLFFLITGIFSLGLFIFRRKEKMYFVFGILCVCMGLWVLSSTEVWHRYIEPSKFLFYLMHAMPFLSASGICLYFEQIYGAGYRSIIRRLWQFFLAFALVESVRLALQLNWATFYLFIYTFFALFAAAILFLFVTSVQKASQGNREAVIVTAGFAVLSAFGIFDILGGIFRLYPWSQSTYQWGMFAFMVSLGLVLESRFRSNAIALQKSHKKLQEYSQTLEKRVRERTQDLENKNIELAKLLKELEETQEQLVMQEKMAALGSLVAGVAHEVNTPVGAVTSATDVSARSLDRIKKIFDEGKTLEEVRNNREFIKSMDALQENNQLSALASERIAKLVRSLKAFARLDEAEFKRTNIHDGLDSTLALINYEIKDRIKIVKDYGDIPEINAYPNQLNQVFMNILMNASQAIEGDGVITIKTELEKKNLVVKISDDGGGIPPENLRKIFDPGFTSRGAGVGTGLGLSISYNIIKKHGGEIKVESEVGKGTIFTILLPTDLGI